MKNSPPKFVSKLASLVEINNLDTKVIILPEVKDEENNNWSINVHDARNLKVLPTFIQVQTGVLIISPI